MAPKVTPESIPQLSRSVDVREFGGKFIFDCVDAHVKCSDSHLGQSRSDISLHDSKRQA